MKLWLVVGLLSVTYMSIALIEWRIAVNEQRYADGRFLTLWYIEGPVLLELN